ncbi:inorganic phosphate transporter 2-1, chloroplastic [Iris pallida]|uniref:Inorganic phosphate transporter 2-1, chloroplastic n=1 Tax=Iris pallida TaxID=29817 RepID=A0AAX6HE78_IRIPA|nr:inorganic phosphate transporter 2-1, chloroplastic [Iris pallida]
MAGLYPPPTASSEPWSASAWSMEESTPSSGAPWQGSPPPGSSLRSSAPPRRSSSTNASADSCTVLQTRVRLQLLPHPLLFSWASQEFPSLHCRSARPFPLLSLRPWPAALPVRSSSAESSVSNSAASSLWKPRSKRRQHQKVNHLTARTSASCPTYPVLPALSCRSSTESSATCRSCRPASCRSRTEATSLECHRPAGRRAVHSSGRRSCGWRWRCGHCHPTRRPRLGRVRDRRGAHDVGLQGDSHHR